MLILRSSFGESLRGERLKYTRAYEYMCDRLPWKLVRVNIKQKVNLLLFLINIVLYSKCEYGIGTVIEDEPLCGRVAAR